MTPSRTFRDLLGVSALSTLLFTAGVLVPVAGPAFGFLAAAPIVWITIRHGLRAGALAGCVAVPAILASGIAPPAAAFYVLEHLLPGLFVGVRLTRGGSLFRTCAVASLLIAALLLGFTMIVLRTQGSVNPVALFDREFRDSLESMGAGLRTGGTGDGPSAIPPELLPLLGVMRRIFPALALVGIFVECAINALLALRVLARSPASPVRQPSLTTFALPEPLVWVIIPCLGLLWWPRREVATVAMNLSVPLLFAYLLQGLSIVLSGLQRIRISRFGLALVLLGVLLQPYLLALPLLLGLLDFRFDFRRRWTPAGTPTL